MWEEAAGQLSPESTSPSWAVNVSNTSWEKQFHDLMMAIARNLFIPGSQLTCFSDWASFYYSKNSVSLEHSQFSPIYLSSLQSQKEKDPGKAGPSKARINLNEVINYRECFLLCAHLILTLPLGGQGPKGHKLFYSWGNWGRKRLSHLSV